MDEEDLDAVADVGSVRVFMSYRRADDRHFIGRLHDRLCDAFGEEKVFRDIDSIPAGTNFRQVILRTLNEVDVVVAVIGPNWAQPSDGHDAADTDYVFLELVEALRYGKPVLPVLLEDTEMPSAHMLPSDLRPLVDINAISVHGDPAFRRESTRLVVAIGAVVAEHKARLAREKQEADEQARRTEAERSERERLAEQLRAEERAARARLAELEEAATRRQIEQERARLNDIEEQLRHTELVGHATPAAEPVAAEPVAAEPAAAEPAVEAAAAPSRVGVKVELPWFQILIVAALILGVVGLPLNRSVDIDGSEYLFNEFSSNMTVDITVWILTLAIAIPLLLGNRLVEQRFVLAGVIVATCFYEVLQSSGTVRYGGPDPYDEGSWFLVKLLEIACLGGAYRILRKRSSMAASSARRYRIALVALALVSAFLLIAATYDQWHEAPGLVEAGAVPDRSPFALWILLVALGPIVATVGMAVRGSYGAQISLATLATLGAVSYFSEATYLSANFDIDGSGWIAVALSQVLLAAVAWSAVAAQVPSPPISGD
jgi:TIR domain